MNTYRVTVAINIGLAEEDEFNQEVTADSVEIIDGIAHFYDGNDVVAAYQLDGIVGFRRIENVAEPETDTDGPVVDFGTPAAPHGRVVPA